ncbi:MAG TPA: type II secretion system protein [Candidatus Gastranaerophilaceae bacterium]|nr:type II secretion system protein [Candidatus Gastranaerophilaceae bacterium]HPT41732.1 type II secretion system protein [Candidatus Gastranaerophilaceae bacterium]
MTFLVNKTKIQVSFSLGGYLDTKGLRIKIAFTLAEVLIVLGIIGMIADLTLPSLIANFQKEQYVIALKKAYTTFNQALAMMSNDMGCPGDLKCTGLFALGLPPDGIDIETYRNNITP